MDSIKKNLTKITYEEINKDLNHFEISFLVTSKATEIFRSGNKMISNISSFKKKVAVAALEELCSIPNKILDYKKEIQNYHFSQDIEEKDDEYNYDYKITEEEK